MLSMKCTAVFTGCLHYKHPFALLHSHTSTKPTMGKVGGGQKSAYSFSNYNKDDFFVRRSPSFKVFKVNFGSDMGLK